MSLCSVLILNLKMSRHARLEIVFLLARGVTLKSVKLLRDIPDESMILHPASRVRSVIHGWFLFYTPKDVREGLGAPTTSGGAIIIRCGKTGGRECDFTPRRGKSGREGNSPQSVWQR